MIIKKKKIIGLINSNPDRIIPSSSPPTTMSKYSIKSHIISIGKIIIFGNNEILRLFLEIFWGEYRITKNKPKPVNIIERIRININHWNFKFVISFKKSLTLGQRGRTNNVISEKIEILMKNIQNMI